MYIYIYTIHIYICIYLYIYRNLYKMSGLGTLNSVERPIHKESPCFLSLASRRP